jgi:hypothetical protein
MPGQPEEIHGQNNHFHVVYCATSVELWNPLLSLLEYFPRAHQVNGVSSPGIRAYLWSMRRV